LQCLVHSRKKKQRTTKVAVSEESVKKSMAVQEKRKLDGLMKKECDSIERKLDDTNKILEKVKANVDNNPIFAATAGGLEQLLVKKGGEQKTAVEENRVVYNSSLTLRLEKLSAEEVDTHVAECRVKYDALQEGWKTFAATILKDFNKFA
jgi:hypothetical protein